MEDIATLIADMVRAGVSPEIIGRTAAIFASKEPISAKSSGAIRQERYRERKASQNVTSDACDVTVTASPSPLIPPNKDTPKPLEINPPISPQPQRAASIEFSEWYALFPNKVGRGAAEKAFASARKRSSFEEIMAGVRRYAAKRDDRPWCNPATWLNQDRWGDQPANGSGPPSKSIDWAKRMEYFRTENSWSPAWGPKPGEVGCKAPQ